MHYDVFNGDADGIISLLQLRLYEPKTSTLVTGIKRNIKLLEPLECQLGDSFTVLDISMESNRLALMRLLPLASHVFYADHHISGEIPQQDNLDAHLDFDPDTCTALIIDKWLGGRYHSWAIAAAYGDNLIAKANELAEHAQLTSVQQDQLQELGTLINYNGYGAKLTDLHFDPADLFVKLLAYDDPFAVIADQDSPYHALKLAYQHDMEKALAITPRQCSESLRLFELPNEAYSRRIIGAYGNLLANQTPNRAHAVLTENDEVSYSVSLRAPLNNKQGAGAICAQFSTGGGRAGAAGINRLPKKQLAEFVLAVESYYAIRG
ncbi:acetyltransferase [Vibrio ostreicida]|uniref:acetyltransferase n=1 Tax=Vibrio ostreicida TaxID=526588 RepID=UPI000970846A|nr:acetyltransferase [Vibrio ostreicida]